MSTTLSLGEALLLAAPTAAPAAASITTQITTPSSSQGKGCVVVIQAPSPETYFGMRAEYGEGDGAEAEAKWRFFDPQIAGRFEREIAECRDGKRRRLSQGLEHRPLPSGMVFKTWWREDATTKLHSAVSIVCWEGGRLKILPAEHAKCAKCGEKGWMAFWRLKNDRKVGCPNFRCRAANEKGKPPVLVRVPLPEERLPLGIEPAALEATTPAVLPELVASIMFDDEAQLAAFHNDRPALGSAGSCFQRENPDQAVMPIGMAIDRGIPVAGQWVATNGSLEVGRCTVEELKDAGLIPLYEQRPDRPQFRGTVIPKGISPKAPRSSAG